MFKDALRTVILRELRGLNREIAAYPDNESVWQTAPGVPNSAGTLALHMAGNLRHFIGATLTGNGYIRDRAAEFGTKGLTRAELSGIVTAAINELEVAFDKVTDEQLASEFPIPVAERRLNTGQFLMHLAVHLSYHLGQLDYHRRLLTSSTASVDTVSPKDLPQVE